MSPETAGMDAATARTGRPSSMPTARSSTTGTGVRHRKGAPACVYVNGTEKWYRDGLRHRDPEEGPAATHPNGRRIWFVDGVKVREER